MKNYCCGDFLENILGVNKNYREKVSQHSDVQSRLKLVGPTH